MPGEPDAALRLVEASRFAPRGAVPIRAGRGEPAVRRVRLLAATAAILAGCAAGPSEPPVSESHACVVIPTGMVECSIRVEARGAASQ